MTDRPTILLTHDPESRANYYGPRALSGLAALGELHLNETEGPLSAETLAEAARGCQLVVADRATAVPAAFFAAAEDVVAVLRGAVDVRTIDLEAASRHGVLVTNASPGFVDAVAELILGMLVDLARGITDATLSYRAGRMPEVRMGRQLAGSTVGILGYGSIGRRLAGLCRNLGMSVLVNDPYKTPEEPGIEAVGFEDCLARADFVVCLVVANESTENLLDAAAFARMQPHACFVNVARGNLVDEAALLAALEGGRIAAAAMDVGRAPDQMPSPELAALPNVVATPHIGGLTPAAIESQALETVEQVRALVEGRLPHNALNAEEASRLERLGIAVARQEAAS